MASATVDSATADDRLRLESIPTVDLRLLSQPELYALSLCSDCAFDPRRCDDVVIPKIDRSVFNESAGSRKQTYSRLRLAPRKPQTTSAAATPLLRSLKSAPDSAAAEDENDPERAENSRIIDLLKGLFAANTKGDELVPIRVEYSESVPELPNVRGANVMKRKRGRPRKSDIAGAVEVKVEAEGDDNAGKEIVVFENAKDGDMEVLNGNGDVVDVRALANLEDPYGPELKRRTEGLETEEGLLGFLGGLNGPWASRRKKKKIVDASDFGTSLPKGWKLMLSIKKKEGRVWLFCRRYMSPNGKQFVSCKEISSYLLSFPCFQDANWPDRAHSDENTQLTSKKTPVHASDIAVGGDNKRGDVSDYLPSPVAYIPHDHEMQTALNTENPMEVQVDILKCDKCGGTFDVKDDLLHHQLSCLRRKRSKFGTSITDGVIIKDGKYECQFCHKTFIERRRYNGHVGNHVKKNLKSTEASPGVLSIQNVVGSLDGVPPGNSMMQITLGDENDIVAATLSIKVDDGHIVGSPHFKSKSDGKIETYTEKLDHDLNFLDHNELGTDANRKMKSLPVELCDRDHNTSDDNLGRVEEIAAVAAKHNNYLASEATDEDNNICEPRKGGSESGIVTVSDNGNTCDNKTMEDGRFTSTREEIRRDREDFMNIEPVSDFCGSCAEQDEDVVTEVKQLGSSDVFSHVQLRDEQGCNNDAEETHFVKDNELIVGVGSSCDGRDRDAITSVELEISSGSRSLVPNLEEPCATEGNEKEASTCMMEEADRQKDSKNSLLCLSGYDQPYERKNIEDRVSAKKMEEPKLDEVQDFRNSAFAFANIHDGLTVDGGTSVEQERSSGRGSLVPISEKPCPIESHANEASTCMMEESDRQKDSRNSLLCLSEYEQTCGIENIDDNVSARKMEPKLDEVQTFRNSEFPFGNIHDGLTMDVGKREGNLEFLSLVPPGNHLVGGQDNVTRAYGSREEVHKQGSSLQSGSHTRYRSGQSCDDAYTVNKVPTSSVAEPKLDEVANCRNTELLLAFGNVRTGVGIEQMCVQSNQRRVENSMVVEPHPERGSGSGSLGQSWNGKTCDLQYGLNMGYGVWEGTNVDDIGYPGNEKLMIGFSSGNLQPDAGVMSDSIWRTNDANFLRSGLADNSHPQVQSSSCFPPFGINSEKENEIFSDTGKYGTMSGFEGMRSGSAGHVEFNFLPTPNLNSLPESSNVLSFDTGMGQGFDSSFWMEKDVMTANVNIGHQVASLCAWCGNEFHHEPLHNGIQAGAIGSMCPTCSAKISLQFNVL